MRISLCGYYSLSHGGGGERILADAANFLFSRGHEVSIHCLPFRKREGSLQLNDHVSYCERPFHRFKTDVCYHVYAPLVSHLFFCKAPKIAGLHGAIVADFDSNHADFFKQGPFVAGAYVFRKLFGEMALRSFDAVHTVNPEGLPLRHKKVFEIPNWVDCSVSDESLKIKKERQPTFRVLFVGKPDYAKGFDRFIALSNMFQEEDVEFVSTFPPAGRYADHGKLRSLGYVPQAEMSKLYSTAAVLVHPVRKETFGLVILESLASGTPVITTPIQCHTALALPVRYASTLAEFLNELRDLYTMWKKDYDTYLRLGEEGAEAVRRYDRTILLPQFENMLAQVA